MALHPKSLSFKFDIRLEHLGAADAVETFCSKCAARFVVAPYQLHNRFDASKHLNAIAERFVCPKCGWRASVGNRARWALLTARPPMHIANSDTA